MARETKAPLVECRMRSEFVEPTCRVDSRSTGQDSHLVRTRWGAEMLCFNYTVGFSWSVAVLNGLCPTL